MKLIQELIERLLTEAANEANQKGWCDKALAKAGKMRTEEKAENKETVYEAKAGLEATQKAMQILSRFYATAAKAKVDLSLAQGPFDDAPDAGFKNGEAYTAAGSDSGGIVGMLEVIASDFTRTIEETQASEKAAEKEHLQFMTESSMSLQEKKMA